MREKISDYPRVWVWYNPRRNSLDNPGVLPVEVYDLLDQDDAGFYCTIYGTREEAIADYDQALMQLAVHGDPAAQQPLGVYEVKDKRTFDTGSVRDSRTGKGRFDLLPPAALRRLAQHFERGAEKYGDRNWEKGQPLQSYLDSALRHIFNHQEGMRDEDHLIAAVWNLLVYVETEHRVEAGELPAELDDFPSHRLGGAA